MLKVALYVKLQFRTNNKIDAWSAMKQLFVKIAWENVVNVKFNRVKYVPVLAVNVFKPRSAQIVQNQVNVKIAASLCARLASRQLKKLNAVYSVI